MDDALDAAEMQVPGLAVHVLDGRIRFDATTALALGEEAVRTFDRTFPGLRKTNTPPDSER